MDKRLMIAILQVVKDSQGEYVDAPMIQIQIERGEVLFEKIECHLRKALNEKLVMSVEGHSFHDLAIMVTRLTCRGERVLEELKREIRGVEL